MSNELTQSVIAVIAQTQRIPSEKVTLESTFEELGMDSLDAVNVIFALEEKFNINIPDEETRDIRNVRQIVEGVNKLLGDGGQAARA
jgi:acyl carrier protein